MDRSADKLARVEGGLQEALERIEMLNHELRKMEAVIGELFIKAQLSHSLIVIRKVSEDKIEELNRLERS